MMIVTEQTNQILLVNVLKSRRDYVKNDAVPRGYIALGVTNLINNINGLTLMVENHLN